jgi:hydroxymethylpyrimidine pyrophosphatase-like HAD family hydrolase
MGNGVAAAKQAAHFVTKSVLEDGIAHGLKHFGLI